MTSVIVNPGTETNDTATLANAEMIVREMIDDLGLSADSYTRAPDRDHDGWFGYTFTKNGTKYDVDIPGDDPDITIAGRPFEARRLYVNGSSWLYGYALNRFADSDERVAE